ncbi:putative ArCR [uncultured archaeon]|nr:putative ArCR [uncultured archaeon]
MNEDNIALRRRLQSKVTNSPSFASIGDERKLIMRKSEIRRIVLDVLKPYSPDITLLAKSLADLPGVDGVNISVYEIDHKVENVKITVEGAFHDIEAIKQVIMDSGGSLHSMDEVAVGVRLVEEEETLQDRTRAYE